MIVLRAVVALVLRLYGLYLAWHSIEYIEDYNTACQIFNTMTQHFGFTMEQNVDIARLTAEYGSGVSQAMCHTILMHILGYIVAATILVVGARLIARVLMFDLEKVKGRFT